MLLQNPEIHNTNLNYVFIQKQICSQNTTIKKNSGFRDIFLEEFFQKFWETFSCELFLKIFFHRKFFRENIFKRSSFYGIFFSRKLFSRISFRKKILRELFSWVIFSKKIIFGLLSRRKIFRERFHDFLLKNIFEEILLQDLFYDGNFFLRKFLQELFPQEICRENYS